MILLFYITVYSWVYNVDNDNNNDDDDDERGTINDDNDGIQMLLIYFIDQNYNVCAHLHIFKQIIIRWTKIYIKSYIFGWFQNCEVFRGALIHLGKTHK